MTNAMTQRKIHVRIGRNDLSSLVAHLLIRVIIAVGNFFYKELLKHLTVQSSSISFATSVQMPMA